MTRTRLVIVTASAILFATAITLRADPLSTKPLARSTSDEEISKLIQRLGDASFEQRTYASRRLSAIGMPAAAAVGKVVDGSCLETSLRARALLRDFENRLFANIHIQLAFSATQIPWDQSVDLIITMSNPTRYAVRVPFDLKNNSEAIKENPARQVGDLLDVSDFLRIRSDSGRVIELTIDDILMDPDIYATVHSRLDGGPVSDIPPGESAVFRVRDFNRGWARYRLLDSGSYSVALEYVPPWVDTVLATQRIGAVTSNEATIVVDAGAPQTISRGAELASIHIRQTGDAYIAELTNQTDQPTVVNRNFGPSAPFAQGQWILEREHNTKEVTTGPEHGVSWNEFDEKKLAAVEPGGQVQLATITVSQIQQALKNQAAPKGGDAYSLRFSYSNLCDRQWQKRQRSALLGNPQVPPVLQTPLPMRMLTVRQMSLPFSLDSPD